MLNIVTRSNLHYDEREETVDMCRAIEEMRNDAIAEGIEIGIAKGKEEGVFSALVSLVKKGMLTLAQAAEETNMTVSEFEAKTGLNA